MKLILASGSPRRRELLTEAGYDFKVVVPSDEAECGVCSSEGPAALVAELAYRKAADVVRKISNNDPLAVGQRPTVSPKIILAADTVAECGGQILGKPASLQHAREMLTRLSGREHRVYSGVCLWPIPGGEPQVRVAQTTLRMDPLSDKQLEEYLESGQWEGKAGAFGYQDRLGWVHVLQGSESNVVGLPMELLAEMLTAQGFSTQR